ncbi:hypothetical protein CEXT_432031 [Caerostris extrusa]|uniref:Uncharacterized protein n=1 Tax=Caerostris extrusa TaxID=172846 RepID=A0AAV4XXQ4_CAEEX|nr:hypothetical protein CEXT_432031 [Caerostris extrusa]
MADSLWPVTPLRRLDISTRQSICVYFGPYKILDAGEQDKTSLAMSESRPESSTEKNISKTKCELYDSGFLSTNMSWKSDCDNKLDIAREMNKEGKIKEQIRHIASETIGNQSYGLPPYLIGFRTVGAGIFSKFSFCFAGEGKCC